MKNISLFLVAALVSLATFAETAKIAPTWEGNYRTNNAEPTSWAKVTTSDAQFEIFNGARFFAVQTWTIANISKVSKLEFMYQRVSGQTNNGDISFWFFPYTSMVEDNKDFDTKGLAFLDDVKEVLGVYPGNEIDSLHAPFVISESVDTLDAHFRVVTLEGEQLAAFVAGGTVLNDYLNINLLLNTFSAKNNYKYYHTGDAASYCTVTYEGEIEVPVILNNTTLASYTELAKAVAEANDGDVLTINEDVETADSTLIITKNLTIAGATGAEKLICKVPADKLMVLANGNEADYTVTFKNLIVDGENVVRDRQLFDLNGKAKMAFDGVQVINTTYDAYHKADVKTAGSNVILSGNNSFPAGIALNKNKRIDHQGASHAEPIRIVLSGDYAENYAIVLNCNDSTRYTAVDADDAYEWTLYVSNNKELKGTKKAKEITTAIVNKNSRVGYDDLRTAVEEAAAGDLLLVYSDVTIADTTLHVTKELTLQGVTGEEKILNAVPADQIALLVSDTVDFTLTIKALTVDGQDSVRAIQTFDNNGKAKIAFDSVRVVNTTYNEGIGDVKCAGGNILLSSLNDFPAGIVLNKNKRVDHHKATHTAENPIRLRLAADYQEDYAIVLHCADSTLYTVEDLAGEAEWVLYVGNGELKGKKKSEPQAVDNVATETKAVKVIRNGQLFILRGEERYNILGTKLQ